MYACKFQIDVPASHKDVRSHLEVAGTNWLLGCCREPTMIHFPICNSPAIDSYWHFNQSAIKCLSQVWCSFSWELQFMLSVPDSFLLLQLLSLETGFSLCMWNVDHADLRIDVLLPLFPRAEVKGIFHPLNTINT